MIPQQGQQQGLIQEAQQQSPQPATAQGQQGQIYPTTKEQSDKFFYGIIKELHSTDAYDDGLKDKRAPLGVRIGSLAARALVNMFKRVKEQTGLPAGKDFVIHAIKFVCSEVATMAKELGEKPTKEDMVMAIKLAGDNLEQSMAALSQQQQGQGQPQQQPPMQGQPQGLLDEAAQQQGVM